MRKRPRLIQRRKIVGYTQERLAEEMGVDRTTVVRWERAECEPQPWQRPRLGALLKISADDLHNMLLDVGDPPEPPTVVENSPVVLVPWLELGMVYRPDDVEALITALVDAAAAQAIELVAVYGPGGFGKTTLATQVCHDPQVRQLFAQIVWVETGEQCTPARLVQLISDLCVHLEGTRPALADPEQAGFHLARVLGDRRVLMVIDNVWSAADLAPFLLGGAACVRLVTTRNVRVCPARARLVRLGPMSATEIRELLSRSVSHLGTQETARLADLCGGWPLLATVVGSNVDQDIAAGAPPQRAVSEAGQALQTHGPHAFDVSDAEQRRHAIGQAITSSLQSLEDNVTINGGSALRDRYLSLAIFPAATPVPLAVLCLWWEHSYGWTPVAVRQFCRMLADRSLVDTYLADRDAIVLHDVFRLYLRHLVGDQWSPLHRSLVDAYRVVAGRRWADLTSEHGYLWRGLSFHLREAQLYEELVDVLADPNFIVKKVSLLGHESLVGDRTTVDAVAAVFPDDHPAHVRWRVASALTSTGYLLHGLTSTADIACTLLASLLRSVDEPEVVDQLRRISTPDGEGLHIRWACKGPAPTGDADAGHVGAVTGVAVHDTHVVSCGEDGTVRVWDLPGRRQVHRFRGHTGWVYATAISADGDLVASAGDDGVIRLWRRQTGQPAGVLVAHTRRVRGLAFPRTGRLLVSGAEDGQICLWDTERPALIRTMDTPKCPVWSVAVGCADTLIAAAGEDEFIRLYDLGTGHLLDEKAVHRDWVRSVAFAPTAPLLASGSGDRTVRVWSVADNHLTAIRTTDKQPARVRCVAVPTSGDLVWAAGEDATIGAFTAEGLAGQRRMPPGVDWIRALALAPDGTVVAGCEDGAVRLWTGPDRDQLDVLASGSNTVWSTAFAEDGRLALLGRGDGLIEIRDSTTTDLVRALPAGHGRVWSLASAATYVAAACGDGTVRVYSLQEDWTLKLNTGEPRSWAVALNHTGTRVAASTSSGVVRVWQLPSGRLLWERTAHSGRIRSIAFDTDGDLLVTGGGEGTARLWRISADAQVGEFASPSGWVRAVTLDGPGARVAVGSGPGEVFVRDLAEDRFVAHLFGHSGRVLMLGFTPDGDRLVSAAADGTIRSWSLSEQRQLARVRADASLQCAATTTDGSHVIAGSAAGVVAITVNHHQAADQPAAD